MTPATAVPCMSSVKVDSPPCTKVAVFTTRSFRSGWVVSTPVSTMATRTPFPVAQRWATSARIERGPYCRRAYGSPWAIWRLWKTWLTCTDSTDGSARSWAITSDRGRSPGTWNTTQSTPSDESGKAPVSRSP